MISFKVVTSPKAPRPITLRDSKSSRPSRVRFSRRNSVSFLACWERRIRFCRDGDAQSSVTVPNYAVLYKASGTHTCSQKHCYTIRICWKNFSVCNPDTHLFICQSFLIHHFLQLLLPIRKFDHDYSQAIKWNRNIPNPEKHMQLYFPTLYIILTSYLFKGYLIK